MLSCGIVCYALQRHFSSSSSSSFFFFFYKVVLNFESVNEILKCDHSNESSAFRRRLLFYQFFSIGNLRKNDVYFLLCLYIRRYNVEVTGDLIKVRHT